MSRASIRLLRPAALALLSALALMLGTGASPAYAGAAWWRLDAYVAPTHLAPGEEAFMEVTAADAGYADIEASATNPVTVTVALPKGVVVGPTSVVAAAGHGKNEIVLSCSTAAQTVTCRDTGPLPVYASEAIAVRIPLEVSPSAPLGSPLSYSARVQGGAAGSARVASATLARSAPVDGLTTQFGVDRFAVEAEEADGSTDSQAGSHPFQLTTTLGFTKLSQHHFPDGSKTSVLWPRAAGLPKNLDFALPPGLVGDLTRTPRCSEADFATDFTGWFNACPANSAIGTARVTVFVPPNVGLETVSVPVFNLPPAQGEPARFGFEVFWLPVVLTTSVRAGSDYAVDAKAHYLSEAGQVLSSSVTLWGVPGDSRHDAERGWACIDNGYWAQQAQNPAPCVAGSQKPTALLTLPTRCAGTPSAEVSGEAWEGQALQGAGSYPFATALDGCNALPFAPSADVRSESHAAATPSGLTIHIHVPQTSTLSPGGLAEADVRRTTMVLPPGVLANAGAADGLQACEAHSVGFSGLGESVAEQLQNDRFSPSPANCPPAAKLGTVRISTPLLEHEMRGGVYLAKVDTEPFLGDEPETPLVLYILAEDPASGVRVKLAGALRLDPASGQLTATFANTPPLPFEDLTVSLFGGPQASQSTPPFCGTYATSVAFDSWAGSEAESSSPMTIDEACPSTPRDLTPSFGAGSLESRAGAYSPFEVALTRPDPDQPLTGLSVHLPEGAAAMISKVTPCPEPASPNAPWSCGPESLIGHAVTLAGLGSHPVSLGGAVYLTSGYDGAPFGLLVQTHAKAGPFDLGTVNVRSRIDVDPRTAAVTVTTDAGRRTGPGGDELPTIIHGVPAQIKQIQVSVDRPEFTFNPTSCAPRPATGIAFGSEGAASALSTPFQAADCAALGFAPTLSAETIGAPSRLNGVGLRVLVKATRGQANIAATKLQLPSTLPSRQPSFKGACLAAVFAVSPTSCPASAIVGRGVARTPVLRTPLEGSAYLVSYGNLAFPDLEFVLHGEGITLVLDGHTKISKGVTYSNFEELPDAPLESFEAVLPPGPHSILGTYGDLCAEPQKMPTTIAGQNGITLSETTVIKIAGCGGVKSYRASSGLARAIHRCRRRHAAGVARRRCERSARRRLSAAYTGRRARR